MRIRRNPLRGLLALIWPAFGPPAGLAGPESATESAEDMLRAGRFGESEAVLAKRTRARPRDSSLLLGLGYAALLRNGLEDAEHWLTAALEIEPRLKQAQALLAEVYYRRDDFKRAAPLFERVGRAAKARKLASFGGQRPYQIEAVARTTRLPFRRTDPLPVVTLSVNGSEPVRCIIDTGGGELILGAELARRAGVASFGGERGVFAGGKRTGLEQGRADSVLLGDLAVRHVPVVIMDLAGLGRAVGEERIDGIIGTVLLYHFLSTIDYAGGQLVLERRDADSRQSAPQTASGSAEVAVPFWMADDHFIVAWGAVNGGPPLLLFVDTGLAGAGFTCPESTLRGAALVLRRDQARKGMGVAGEIEAVPFVVDEISLGEVRRRRIDGLAGPFPPQLEWGLGFHIRGLISHQFFRAGALTLDFESMQLRLR